VGTALTGWVQSTPAVAPGRTAGDAGQGASRDVAGGVGAAAGTPILRPPSAPSGGPAAAHAADPLDINRADAPALEALPGIGPALARRILEHRERRGAFRTPEDLLQVPGIGAQRYARLRDRIRAAETP
jgi:competence protein ComEA